MMQQGKRLYAINFIAFFSLSCVFAQMIPFLNAVKYSLMERAYILAATAIVATVGQCIFGYLCDYYRKIKPFFLLAFIIFTIASMAMLWQQEWQLWYHFISVGVMGGFVKVVMGLNETWMLEWSSQKYGSLRAFGAIGLSLGAPFAGIIVDFFSFKALAIVSFILLVVLFILVIPVQEKERNTKPITKKDIYLFLKNKRYISIVSILFLIYMIGTADQYVVVDKLMQLQATKVQIGWKWAVQSAMEIPLFFLANILLKKLKPITLLFIGIAMYGIKFFLYGYVNSVLGIILVASLQLVTLPVVMLASKYLIQEVTPQNLSSSSQMFAMAIFIGVSGLITPLVTSYLANHMGYNATLYVVAIFTIVPFIATYFYQKQTKKR